MFTQKTPLHVQPAPESVVIRPQPYLSLAVPTQTFKKSKPQHYKPFGSADTVIDEHQCDIILSMGYCPQHMLTVLLTTRYVLNW
jgi:hypothetical protein